ncbi:tetratricopeptide repeat protein [Rhizobium leguminosarum]
MTKYAILGYIWLCAISAGFSAVTALPAFAVDNMQSTDAPDLTSVRAKIDAKDYAGALAELRGLAEDNQQADVYNLMGYTLRKTGDYRTSLTYYTKALELQPDHRAAREYLGELYVETGEMAKAEEQVSSLKQLCPSGCEELEDLQEVIAANGGN